jgi:hypothetical protein
MAVLQRLQKDETYRQHFYLVVREHPCKLSDETLKKSFHIINGFFLATFWIYGVMIWAVFEKTFLCKNK